MPPQPSRNTAAPSLSFPMAASSSPRNLLDLPSEILEPILALLRVPGPSLQDLASVTRVCRVLRQLAEPVLYRSIHLRHKLNGEKFAKTVEQFPGLVVHVRELHIHYHRSGLEDFPMYYEVLGPTIACLFNLERLVVRCDDFKEIPWFPRQPERQQKENEKLMAGDPLCQSVVPGSQVLRRLKSCNFYFNNMCEAWELDTRESLFFHHELRGMSLTGARFDEFFLPHHHKAAPRSTPLEELVLLMCDITPEGLSELLTYPRALKHFTFKGECHFKPKKLSPNRAAYLNALMPHRLSLKSLDLDLYYQPCNEGVDLHEFSMLEELTIDPRMLKGDDEAFLRLGEVFPPSLRKITFRGFICFDQLPQIILQKVSEAELPHLHSLNFEHPSSWTESTEVYRSIKSYEEAFATLGVRLPLRVERTSLPLPEHKEFPCKCLWFTFRKDETLWWYKGPVAGVEFW